jgi:hypothetical protein
MTTHQEEDALISRLAVEGILYAADLQSKGAYARITKELYALPITTNPQLTNPLEWISVEEGLPEK